MLPVRKVWAVGFRHWSEAQLFGFLIDGNKQQGARWFISLLSRLKELGKYDPDDFVADRSLRDAWRYHEIDWGAKAVPIQRSDLHWLPAEYRDNDDDYPLLQFQLSKGLGRVIGFWDENLIFQIVLLDPLHNLQPSKDYDYTVDPCEPLKCHYSSLIAELDRIGRAMACALDCPTRSRIRDASSGAVPEHMLLIELEADTRAMAIQLIATGKAKGLRDIFEYGVLAMNSE